MRNNLNVPAVAGMLKPSWPHREAASLEQRKWNQRADLNGGK